MFLEKFFQKLQSVADPIFKVKLKTSCAQCDQNFLNLIKFTESFEQWKLNFH